MRNKMKILAGLALAAACSITLAATQQDVEAYQADFNSKVPEKYKFPLTAEEQKQETADILAQQTLAALDHPEFVVVVNKAPSSQHASIYIVDGQDALLIGSARVSTGQAGRKEYYFTPTGLFENKIENGNYRALGTKNENGIRGIGSKGMRVYDFGWQASNAGWGDHFAAQIRLEMHATDPDVLEARLGKPASKGCVRIYHGMNSFIDENGVLDRNYDDHGSWVLSKNKKPNPYDGRFMLVVEHPAGVNP